jgi:hypothetical protein
MGQTWTVPSGVASETVTLYGAAGGLGYDVISGQGQAGGDAVALGERSCRKRYSHDQGLGERPTEEEGITSVTRRMDLWLGAGWAVAGTSICERT